MLGIPLAVDYGEGISIVQELSSYAEGLAETFGAVGRGIGAVLLLIVVFYYISSILDGGKFQIKMLIPFLIFFFVCNFSWIATPVTSFTSTITQSLVSACNTQIGSVKDKYDCDEGATIDDMYMAENQQSAGDAQKLIDDALADYDSTTDYEEDGSSSDGGDDETEPKPKGLFGKMSYHVKKGIGDAATKGSLNMQKELSTQGLDLDDSGKGNKPTAKNLGILKPISSIVSFICKIMSFVLMAFGGVMTAIIVAFGPITWAFAIFPGQGATIKSWFIRLCQFSLWSPICALVDCFSVKLFDIMATAQGAAPILMAIAVAVCNLVALTSVPTIASMIIEGAQGAVSLSQGLQAMGAALTTAGAIYSKGEKLAVGSDNHRTRTMEGIGKQGLSGLARTHSQLKQSGDSNPWLHALRNNEILGRNVMKGKK